jgi:O-antigen ligase
MQFFEEPERRSGVPAGHAARMVVPACLLAAAVGEAVLFDGGFSPASRIVFAVTAAAALAAVLVREPGQVRGFLREPVVIVLLLLGLLGAASAAWTVGLTDDAARWGLVAGAYAAVVVASAALVRSWGRGIEAVAALVCALAAISGVVGLVAAARHAGPFADRVAGAWRPGGTLEYPPALALLQVSALPALLTAMCRGARATRVLAAVGGAVAAAVLTLSESRTGLALAALVCVAAVAAPRFTLRSRRAPALAALALLATMGVAAHLMASDRTDGLARASIAAPTAADPGQRSERAGGFWHGRLHTWRAAAETAADRPLSGAGADAFMAASARHQHSGPVRFAHDLPLELAAELGVVGLLLAVALYATAGAAVWRARATHAAWLLGPAAVAFLASGLADWPWHLAGSGAVWAASLGALVGAASAAPASVPDP